MKIGIIYYSFSGNTLKTCEYLRSRLFLQGHTVEMVRLEPRQEERVFLMQGRQAAHREAPELAGVDFSVAGFDLVIFASPVWALTFAPALRSFLARCEGLENKRCGCVLTCGAQCTSGNALKELAQAAAAKGGKVEFAEYSAGSRAGDPAYLDGRFKPFLDLLI